MRFGHTQIILIQRRANWIELIFVQGFAFRGRPVSLLVAYTPEGSHLFRFSRRSLRLALQSTARSNRIYKIHVHHHHEKIRTSWILYQESRFIVRIFFKLKYFCLSPLLSQPLWA